MARVKTGCTFVNKGLLAILTEHDKIIYKGTKIVIPKSMQPEMKQKIHFNHQGPDACVRRAKDVLFWPGMASEIRHVVSQCSVCIGADTIESVSIDIGYLTWQIPGLLIGN